MYCSIFKQCSVCSVVLVYLIMQSACVSQNRKIKSKKIQLEKMEPVTLFSFKTNYTVEKGQELEFSYESNSSIGTTADYKVEDETIIEYIKTEVSTPNTQEGTGGNNENITFVFKALKIGTTKIIIQEYNQLKLEDQHEFMITIK